MENMNVKKRVTEDILTIDGRTFKIEKFNPLLGNYILLKCMSLALPFGIAEQAAGKMEGAESLVNKNKPQISKEEFIELQIDILTHAYEILPGNTTPVLRKDGTPGILDFSMKIAIQLIIAIIAFNFSDFFGEDASSIIPTGLAGSMFANTKT